MTRLEARHVVLLKAIGALATAFYPYGNGDENVDPHLLLALGQIKGICVKALSDHEKEQHDE